MALFGQAAAFAHIAATAGRHDIFPNSATTFGAWNDMIEGQVRRWFAMPAILATETVAQKYIEPCEGRIARCRNIIFQRDNAGQFHFETG